MVYVIGCVNGLNGNWQLGTQEDGDVEVGSGNPAHASPKGTIYIELTETQGTNSPHRNSDGTSGNWKPMSDD